MKSILKKKQKVDSTYEIQFFMGGDAYCEKYRVKGKDSKTYLLKLYNSSKLSRNDFANKNLLEVKILASLKMGGIVNFVNSGEYVKDNKKYHYIILDFISGETLQDKLERDGAFSEYAAVPLIIYLLEILRSLHNSSNSIIHNNINMNSIYLDYSNNAEKPIVTEFGFARYITSKSNSLDLSRLSPFYIAPELYNGIFTPQSDIFAVGVLFYNLIFGIPPWYIEIPDYQYTNEKLIDAISEKRTEPLPFGIEGLRKFEDNHLKEVIKKALAGDIDNRFKNVDQFISALKRKTELISRQSKGKSKKAVKRKGAGFSAIAGMQDLQDLLYNDVIRALNEPELYGSYGVTIPNGMLLYGPPGCGKTFISERFAEEVGFHFLQLKPSDIKSKYINATEERISDIFKEAVKNAPTIVFIDEIDAVVPSRESEGLHQMQAGYINEFLAQMSNCSEKGIFVIAASNRPEKIDSAILRTGRIDRIIYLPPPDYDARTSMFKLYLKKRPIDLGLNYERLAEMTSNYVSSDIKFLVDEASRFALNLKTRITQEILEKIITETNPSVSKNELEKYKKLKNKLEDKRQKTGESKPRRPIGF